MNENEKKYECIQWIWRYVLDKTSISNNLKLVMFHSFYSNLIFWHLCHGVQHIRVFKHNFT